MRQNFVAYSKYWFDATYWLAHHMPTDSNMCKKIWSVSLTFLTYEFYYIALKKYVILLIQNTNHLANNYSGTELSECFMS